MTFMLAGDLLLPNGVHDRKFRYPGILDALMFAQLCRTFAPGDALSIGAIAEHQMSRKVLAAHEQRSALSMLGVVLSASLLTSANYFVAHELIHRCSRAAVAVGNWLLAFVGDSQFSIAHLYEHHKHVCPPEHPASARPGESEYVFALRSSYDQYIGAMKIEKARLAAQGLPPWHPTNRFLRGQAMTVAIVSVMAWAKLLHEAVNYIRHYSLVRATRSAVDSRHSWDCTASMPQRVHVQPDSPCRSQCARGRSVLGIAHRAAVAAAHAGRLRTIILALLSLFWFRHMKEQLAYGTSISHQQTSGLR